MKRIYVLPILLAIICTAEVGSQGKKKADPPKKKAQQPPAQRTATAPELLQTLPGFKVELLHTAEPATEGSWINLCKDNQGRLIIGGQRNQPVLRATLKQGKVDKLEKLNLPLSETMGLLYAFDSLYVNGFGPGGFGLYRCRDTKHNDQYDDVQLLKVFRGAGEHGPHGVALGPDKQLYIMNGNHTDLPDTLAKDSPHQNWADDLFLPRQWDGNGHAVGRLAPGGYVLRTDPDGKKWELMLGGFRNAYDLAFNADGELFTFDSDMEWDWGLPWYRPIRVNHCISGAEFGWRSGTGKWPDTYADSLGAVVNIGVGSPTGLTNGIGAKFPEKYQKALLRPGLELWPADRGPPGTSRGRVYGQVGKLRGSQGLDRQGAEGTFEPDRCHHWGRRRTVLHDRRPKYAGCSLSRQLRGPRIDRSCQAGKRRRGQGTSSAAEPRSVPRQESPGRRRRRLASLG